MSEAHTSSVEPTDAASHRRASLASIDPFTTPPTSPSPIRPASISEASIRHSFLGNERDEPRPYFRSRRVYKGEIETPQMMRGRDRSRMWLTINPLLGMFCGLGITAFLIWHTVKSVSSMNYCPVLLEDFSSGVLNPDVWTAEVRVGGSGNGEFDELTNDGENLFIKNGQLYLKPTLQNASLIENDSVINLLADGTCTEDDWSSCVAVTNTTNGTIVPPVRSVRLNTKKGANIKYGKVEVRAKVSKGDWLWPAIWMLPRDNRYGTWPQSGEIDIMETRGNNFTYSYGEGGNQIATSTLHWGPDSDEDGYLHTTHYKEASHTQYGDKFHTYGLVWTDKYLYTYVDTQLVQVLFVAFNKFFWKRGQFPLANAEGVRYHDLWSYTGRKSTPFDQYFYLIINVAVGGTNGWFGNGYNNKPWVDTSATAKSDFWSARDQWYPTWQENDYQGQMIVDSVKIWQQC